MTIAMTSDWPLPASGIRFLTPLGVLERLRDHPLGRGLYPVAMGFYPDASRHFMERNQHDNYLLIYCADGYGFCQVGDEDIAVEGGQLLYLPAGQVHAYRADEDTPWTIYWAHYEGQMAEAFDTVFESGSALYTIGPQPRLMDDFESLFELRYCGESLPDYIHGCHVLQEMISYLGLLISRPRESGRSALDLEAVRGFMRQHLHRSINLDQLAAHANLSRFHFSKRFKQMTGQSPMQYFIHLKMQYACRLLDGTRHSVKHIAGELGYSDAYYFSRLFKNTLGLSPAQYRGSKHR